MSARSLAQKCLFFFLKVSLNLPWSFAEWLLIWFIPSKTNTSDQRFRMNAWEGELFWFSLAFSLNWEQKEFLSDVIEHWNNLCKERVSRSLLGCLVPLSKVSMSNTSSAHLRNLKSPRDAWKKLAAGCWATATENWRILGIRWSSVVLLKTWLNEIRWYRVWKEKHTRTNNRCHVESDGWSLN